MPANNTRYARTPRRLPIFNSYVALQRLPRIDRVRCAQALVDQIDPTAIRYRDTLYMPGGPWTVCRVIRANCDDEHYVCTSGQQTKTIYRDEIPLHAIFRKGHPVHPLEKIRHDYNARMARASRTLRTAHMLSQ